MQPKLIAAVLATGLAGCVSAPAGAPAPRAEASVSVRNDSTVTLNCRVRWRGGSAYSRVVLSPGETWRPEARDPEPRSIYCDPPAAAIHYRLREGRAYRLVHAPRSVTIVLRPA